MKIITILFSNFLRKDFINYKYRFNLQEKVQIHHIIPLQWKSHANLILNEYDIDAGYNLIFMPSKFGGKTINTTRVHDGVILNIMYTLNSY